MRMRETAIQDYARELLESQGHKAIAVAAQRAFASDDEGKAEGAETRRRIELALRLMRGPSVS